jgi:hypothetical protein
MQRQAKRRLPVKNRALFRRTIGVVKADHRLGGRAQVGPVRHRDPGLAGKPESKTLARGLERLGREICRMASQIAKRDELIKTERIGPTN